LDKLASRLAEHLFVISNICQRKYFGLRVCMVCTLGGGPLGGAVLLWQIRWHVL